jgi:hypothetical protein
MPVTDSTAVLRSLKEVRDMHAKGVNSLAKMKETVYGAMQAEAKRLGLPIDYLRKCRVFAADYDRERLDALCDACEAGKYPIGWSRVILLLGVPGGDRDALLAAAVQGHWTRQQMAAEIRRRYGVRRKPGAGRRTKLDAADTTDAVYQKGMELCMKFESFMAAMRREGEDGRTPLAQLPPATRGCMERADEAMDALRRALCPKVTEVPFSRKHERRRSSAPSSGG